MFVLSMGEILLWERYYVLGLGVFPSLDPVEEGNRYGYVGGDVVNRVDPSGECWLNERANTLQRDYCHTQFLRYTQDISRQYGKAWSPELHKAIGDQARFWSQLEFEDFLYLWNNPDFNPPSDGSGLAAVLMYTQSATIPNPVAVLVGACTALGVIALLSATLPKRRGLADDIQDFLRYLRESLGRSIPIPIPRDFPIPTPTRDACNIKILAGETVADVVYGSPLGDQIDGAPVLGNAERPWVYHDWTETYAKMFCQGALPPMIELSKGVGFSLLTEGHHRFIASRLVTKRRPDLAVTVRTLLSHRYVGTVNVSRGDKRYVLEWKDYNWR